MRVGDHLVAGTKVGRVRAMTNRQAAFEELAHGSRDSGASEVPMAGDTIDVVGGKRQAREVSVWREEQALASASNKSSAALLRSC